MKNLITIATAKPYMQHGDLMVDPSTMQLMTTNFWDGSIVKYGSSDKISWSAYDVVEQAIASDFFGYEY